MNILSKSHLQILAAAAAFGIGLCSTDTIRLGELSGVFSTAQARIGRPLTPMSYAGVARRTTRRAVAAGAAVGAAGAYYYGRTCVQRVDAYGRVYTTC